MCVCVCRGQEPSACVCLGPTLKEGRDQRVAGRTITPPSFLFFSFFDFPSGRAHCCQHGRAWSRRFPASELESPFGNAGRRCRRVVRVLLRGACVWVGGFSGWKPGTCVLVFARLGTCLGVCLGACLMGGLVSGLVQDGIHDYRVVSRGYYLPPRCGLFADGRSSPGYMYSVRAPLEGWYASSWWQMG